MRIFSTVLLTATFLGSAILPGWCHQPPKPTRQREIRDVPMYSGRGVQDSAMNRLSGSPINPGSGKSPRPSATAAAKPAAGGGAVLQPPPKLGTIDYGGCAGCKKPDTSGSRDKPSGHRAGKLVLAEIRSGLVSFRGAHSASAFSASNFNRRHS